MSKKNNQMSPEELWHAIQEAKTVEAWKQLTNEFNLHVIYTQFRILNDQRRCETYRCGIQKWFLRSLDDYDKQDVFAKCYMADNDGNVHECSTPDHFNCMISDVMKSAHNDGAMVALQEVYDDFENVVEETGTAIPSRLQYVVFEELLKLGNSGKAVNDRSKIIKLFCLFTGHGVRKTTNMVYNGIRFTKHHESLINAVNEALQDLNLPFKIEIDRVY